MAVISNSIHQVSYNTTQPALRITALECGVGYSLKVMSFNGTCISQPTELPAWQSKGTVDCFCNKCLEFLEMCWTDISPSAPCVPTNVVVGGNCSHNFAEVTWQASRGALSYQATATDEDGRRWLCSSNETTCRLGGLVCSQVYSIGVTASKDSCSSNDSAAVMLKTGRASKKKERQCSADDLNLNNKYRCVFTQRPALHLSSMCQWIVRITLPR